MAYGRVLFIRSHTTDIVLVSCTWKLARTWTKAVVLQNVLGRMPTRNGFTIRALATAREEAAKLLRPGDYNLQIGTLYGVSGLPQNMGKEALAAFLGNWPMQPIRLDAGMAADMDGSIPNSASRKFVTIRRWSRDDQGGCSAHRDVAACIKMESAHLLRGRM